MRDFEEGAPASAEWQQRGVGLSQAAMQFGAADLIARCREAAEQFAALGEGETVETMALNGPDREQERALRLPRELREAWRRYRGARECVQLDFVRQLDAGILLAMGCPQRPDEASVWIPVRAWHYMRISPNEPSVARGEGAAYFYVRIVPASWLADAAIVPAATAVPRPPSNAPRYVSEARARTAFGDWTKKAPDFPTKRQSEDWARENNVQIDLVRKLHSAGCRRPSGRPRQAAHFRKNAVQT